MTSSQPIRHSGLVSDSAEPRVADGGFISRPPGVLRFRGKDSIEFLNRMSTNELVKMKDGDARTTVLASEKGRIIDIVRVLVDGGSLIMITGVGRNEAVKTWLEKFIIMEDIAITDETSVYATHSMTIVGNARSLAPLFSVGAPPDISASQFARVNMRDSALIISIDELWPTTTWSILIPDEEKSVTETLQSGLEEISPESFSNLEIEMGVPEVDAEIRPDVNPLELGLERFISGTKGCYIGQEVIARIDTYQKLRRRLSGFIIQPTGNPLPANGTLLADGKEVGEITRHTYSQLLKKHIALGFLDTGNEGVPTTLIDGNSVAQGSAIAVPLPFNPA